MDSWKLAELCGVSRGTVDRALHGRGEVSEKTRERVLRMAASLGYKPNLIGRALSTGRTMTLGVIVFDIDNSFFAEVVSAVEREARARGKMTLLALSRKEPELELHCIDYFAQKKVDGIIIIPVGKGRSFEKHLSGLGIPVVTFGNRISKSFPHVGIDDEAAAGDAVDYLLAKGYERIIYFCPPVRHKGTINLEAQERRLAGFEKTAKMRGCAYEVVPEHEELKTLLSDASLKKKRTAVFCSNDVYAIKLLNTAETLDLNVPSDFGVIGFDNLSILKYVKPRPASVAYPTDETGRWAVESVLSKLEGKPVSNFIVPHSIVDGSTL